MTFIWHRSFATTCPLKGEQRNIDFVFAKARYKPSIVGKSLDKENLQLFSQVLNQTSYCPMPLQGQCRSKTQVHRLGYVSTIRGPMGMCLQITG